MEILLIAGLGWVCYLLWRRVETLEAGLLNSDDLADRLSQLETQLKGTQPHQPVAAAPAPAPTVTPTATPIISPQASAKARTAAPAPVARLVEVEREKLDEPAPMGSFLSRLGLDFEDLFGRLLPIWAGGITLAVAGFFMVRYSIEAGLLTPPVRVMMGFVFGLGLLAGAEAAFRFEHRLADQRVRQALAGAGLATLYASFYLAGSTYGLIGPFAAFAGLAGVTAVALALSFRFGMPSAVLGLVGGFAAPLLVGGNDANVPLLTVYLALVTGGLMVTSRQRRWAWMGLAALGGGLGWGALLLAGVDGGTGDTLAVGTFLLLLGAVLPAFVMPDIGRHRWVIECAAAAMAAGQMAVLIGNTQHNLIAWGLFVLLAMALAVLGWRNPPLRRASGFTSLLVPLMLFDWFDPDATIFALLTASFAAILGGVPVALAWSNRHNRIDLLQLCVIVLALLATTIWQFGSFDDSLQWPIGLAALALAALPALALWRLWPQAGATAGKPALLLAVTVFALLLVGGLYVTPYWAAPLVAGGLGSGLLLLGFGRKDGGLANLAWMAAVLIVALLAGSADYATEVARLGGIAAGTGDGFSVLRWAMPTAFLAALAWSDHRLPARRLAEVAAAAFAYGLAAQVLPAQSLAWFAAAAAIATTLGLRERIAAQATLAAIAGLWAIVPALEWWIGGVEALAGDPMLLTDLPSLRQTALYLLPVPAALGAILWRNAGRLGPLGGFAAVVVGALLLVPLHIAFKHLLALDGMKAFVQLGLAERTVWQVLLLAVTFAAWRLRDSHSPARLAIFPLAAITVLHWSWFTLVIHNPLFGGQAVGPLPILNLLLPAYGLPTAALLWAQQRLGVGAAKIGTLIDGAVMALITVFAISQLRQLFSGTLLDATPMGQTEDLARSITGIVLAIAFLLWGARRGLRNWRLGSLVLMLGAVLKVFLVDAAGLEGLARIASFVALGFSLIGIGWFYTRQLKGQADVAKGPQSSGHSDQMASP